jgi:phage shock protein PspC (stress-responsive transcriptional regulator)
MQRKLERSRTDSRLAGVCGGLGEYLDVDPTLVRLAFILLALYGGHGILLYIILMLVMPPQEAAVATPPKAE